MNNVKVLIGSYPRKQKDPAGGCRSFWSMAMLVPGSIKLYAAGVSKATVYRHFADKGGIGLLP